MNELRPLYMDTPYGYCMEMYKCESTEIDGDMTGVALRAGTRQCNVGKNNTRIGKKQILCLNTSSFPSDCEEKLIPNLKVFVEV